MLPRLVRRSLLALLFLSPLAARADETEEQNRSVSIPVGPRVTTPPVGTPTTLPSPQPEPRPKRQSADPGEVDRTLTGLGLGPRDRAVLGDAITRMQRGENVSAGDLVFGLYASDPERARRLLQLMGDALRNARGAGPGAEASTPLWEDYVKRFPEEADGYSNLGRSLGDQGEHAGAVASLTRAIELGAVVEDNFYRRGFSAERLGDFELANEDAAMAMRLNPRSPMAHSLYRLTEGRPSKVTLDPRTGGVLPVGSPGEKSPSVRAGRPPAAAIDEYLGRGGPTDGQKLSSDLTRVAGRFLQLQDAQSAIAAAQRAAQLNPANAQAHNTLATAYARAGRNNEAEASATRALALAPKSVPALNTRAWARNNLKRYLDALEDARRALGLDPSDAFVLVNQARAQGALGDRAGMLDSLGRAAAADPRFDRLRESATELPQGSDTEVLFAGLLNGAQPQAAPKKPPDWRRLISLVLLTLMGGALVAYGLLRVVSPALRERLSMPLKRLTSRGRATGPGASDTRPPREAPEPPPMVQVTDEEAKIGQYELKRVIATGGMGVVYEAFDRGLDRRVAVKKLRGEIRDDARERERFLREARTVAALHHPHIVEIHAVMEEGHDVYLVFEYVEGKTFKELLARTGGSTLSEALAVFTGVGAALDYAHSRGVIHRDLKPGNIMVDREGRAKVMDFGLARQAQEAARAAATTTLWGTPPYMAPEAEDGELRRESDLYSLGVCLYEALTGDLPFSGSAGAMFAKKAKGQFSPPSRRNPSLPKSLDAVLARALAPEPEDRFSSASELVAAFAAVLKGKTP